MIWRVGDCKGTYNFTVTFEQIGFFQHRQVMAQPHPPMMMRERGSHLLVQKHGLDAQTMTWYDGM